MMSQFLPVRNLGVAEPHLGDSGSQSLMRLELKSQAVF